MEKPSSQKVENSLLEIDFKPEFYSLEKADRFYHLLKEELNWKQGFVRLFGRTMEEPRLTCYYGDVDYKYSSKVNPAQDIHLSSSLKEIVKELEERIGIKFNAVLGNYYRNGQDSMGWHSDDESVHIPGSLIASISFGESRNMKFRNKSTKKLIYKVELNSGSLLIMKGDAQKKTEHSIPKQSNKKGRINLTFRQFLG